MLNKPYFKFKFWHLFATNYIYQKDYNKSEDRNMKRTYQPKKRQRSKVHGFRKRMASASGRNVIKRRRNKGRAILSA